MLRQYFTTWSTRASKAAASCSISRATAYRISKSGGGMFPRLRAGPRTSRRYPSVSKSLSDVIARDGTCGFAHPNLGQAHLDLQFQVGPLGRLELDRIHPQQACLA